MIYDLPIYRPLGDCQLAVEFGDEADLRLNFRVLALQELLKQKKVPGMIDLIPTMRTLGVIFDPDQLTPSRLRGLLDEALPQIRGADTIPSRIIDMPVWYDDPGSHELAERDGLPKYVEHIAKMNALSSVEEFILRHTSTDQWVAAVGWAPGCTFAYALDRRAAMTSPKLETPRPYAIPERYITLGGVCTSITPVSLPSGYRTIGRLAIDIYLPDHPSEHCSKSGVLFRAGDRQRYRSIGPDEYLHIREEIGTGRYVPSLVQANFDIKDYTFVTGGDH